MGGLDGTIQFIIALVIMVVATSLWTFRNWDFKSYVKLKAGKGVARGIIIAVVVVAGIALLSGCTGTYFNDASVFFGLDYTKKQSPQCESTGPDKHTTSNLGLRMNLFESDDKRFRTNAKYTHHSCAFNEDENQYDALGVELEYQLWKKP